MSNLPSEPEFEQAYKGTSMLQEESSRSANCSPILRNVANLALTISLRTGLDVRELYTLREESGIQESIDRCCCSRARHSVPCHLGG